MPKPKLTAEMLQEKASVKSINYQTLLQKLPVLEKKMESLNEKGISYIVVDIESASIAERDEMKKELLSRGFTVEIGSAIDYSGNLIPRAMTILWEK